MGALIVIAATFLLCFVVDKLFTRLFRNRKEHRSGHMVRLNKRYATFGLILAVLGVAAIVSGFSVYYLLLWIGGILMVVLGIAMIVYYMTFGLFYDEDTFVLTTFGMRSNVYHYRDIANQQLLRSGAALVIELYMTDGRAVSLQSGMSEVYPFLDHAFARWCSQKGLCKENCSFHDPDNSCWFPPLEG